MTITPNDLMPLLKLYERLALENYGLRETLAAFPDWTDETVNANIEKHRARVSEQFAVLYELCKDPHQLHEVLSNILKVKKSN